MRNQLLYVIAFCGLLTTTHMTMTMDLSLSETPENSPKSSAKSSQSGSRSNSPRKQEISEILGGEKQQKDHVPTATVFFTNNPDVSANCDYVNSRNIQGTSQSKITFQNKFGTQRTVIAECTGEYNQEKFIVIEEKVGDTTIKSTINMNPDHSQEIKSSDISKKETLEKDIINLDDTENNTQLNVGIIHLNLNKPDEKYWKKEMQKRAQQNKRVTIVMKKIIGISAFTAIIIAILYKYDQLPRSFINALNKILPQNYAI